MKNLTTRAFLLLLMFLPHFLSAQRDESEQLLFNSANPFGCDSILTKNWKNNAWENAEAYGLALNSSNYITEWRFWDTASEMNFKMVFTRNASNMATVVDVWSTALGNGLKNIARTNVTYNANGKVTEELNQSNYTGTAWVNGERHTYTYNGSGNLTERLRERFDAGSSSWEVRSKEVFTFDANNRLTQSVYSYFDGSAWMEEERYTYTYNTNGKIATEVKEINNTSTTNWKFDTRETYTYNTNNELIVTMDETYDNNIWNKTELDSHNLGATNKYSIHYKWENNAWVLDSWQGCVSGNNNPTPPAAPSNLAVNPSKKKDDAKMLLTWKDNADNETGFIIYRSTNGTTWFTVDSVAANVQTYTDTMLAYETKYYYRLVAYNTVGVSGFSNEVSNTTFTSVESLQANMNLSVYPNPVTDRLFVKYSLPNAQQVTVTMYNLAGQLVLRKQIVIGGNGQFNMDVQQYDSGIYTLHLLGENVNMRKLVNKL